MGNTTTTANGVLFCMMKPTKVSLISDKYEPFVALQIIYSKNIT